MKLPETLPELRKFYEDLKHCDFEKFKIALNAQYYPKFIPFYEEHPNSMTFNHANDMSIEFMKNVIADKHGYPRFNTKAQIEFMLNVIQDDFEKYADSQICDYVANWYAFNGNLSKEHQILYAKIKCTQYTSSFGVFTEIMLEYVRENFPQKYNEVFAETRMAWNRQKLELENQNQNEVAKINSVIVKIDANTKHIEEIDAAIAKFQNDNFE